MASSFLSYAKTGTLGLFVGMAGIPLALWLGGLDSGSVLHGPLLLVAAGVSLMALAGLAVAVSAAVVMLRAGISARGGQDLFLSANRSRTDQALQTRETGLARRTAQRLRQSISRRWLLVGDVVEVLSLEEIMATLDGEGKLEGLPFMPEMIPYCGRRVRIFREVDKIYDYGRTKKVKRLRNTVSLAGLRCDGAAHGQCAAGCYLFWKTSWLRPVRSAQIEVRNVAVAAPRIGSLLVRTERESGPGYVCQFTELSAASTPVSPRDPRLDLRPLLAGNITLRGFLVAMATRCFNRAQAWRGGLLFPHVPKGRVENTPTCNLGLTGGAPVRVAPIEHIARTLNSRNRNRGLWFDHDMVKFCGHSYPVWKRVDRIIDDVHGAMVPMKTACIALEGVVATGEYHHFCPQEEPLFWREIWLQPLASSAAQVSQVQTDAAGGVP